MPQMKSLKKSFFLFVSLISFLINYSQPCFLPRVDYTFPGTPGNIYHPASITAADFNGDGNQDIASANYTSIYGVSIKRGTGLGSFTQVMATYTLGYTPESIVSADFNVDGKMDIAAVGSPTTTSHRVSILNGLGTGFFSPAATYTLAGDVSTSGWVLEKGDYNGDGKIDLCYLKTGSPTSSVTCLLGNGFGNFPTVNTYTMSGIFSKMCTSDFNKDGKSDIALNNSSSVLQIKFGTSTGLTTAATTYTSLGSGWLTSGDFNGDTNQDLGVISGNVVKVLLGSPTGTLSAPTSYSMGANMGYISSSDYNMDGYDDLVMSTNSTSKLVTLLGSNSGTLSQGLQYNLLGDTRDIISSEFTSDGKPDVVLADYTSNSISILKSGLQTFSASSGTICSGKSFTISPTGAVSYSYSSGSAIVSPLSSTVYTITGQFAEGCNNTTTSNITVIPTPTIAVSNGSVCTGFSYTIVPSGANTYTYSNGNIVSPTVNTTYTVAGTATNGCISSSTLMVTVFPVLTPSICLVTLDSLANNNEIYWEKSLYANVDSFIIHREVSTNIYKRIGAVSVNAFSMYTDTNRSIGPANGNPNFTAYKYKLQIRNICGNYGPLSLYHETIFVQDQLNGNFNWNSYSIESSSTPVANYNLKRLNLTTGVETLVGSTTGSLFTDPEYATYSSTNTKWFVDATGFNCNPTLKINPNSSLAQKVKTKSNNTNELITATNNIQLSNNYIKAYPNPAKDKLYVDINIVSENMILELENILGQKILEIAVKEKTTRINIADYDKGVYSLSVKVNNRTISVKKIVLE